MPPPRKPSPRRKDRRSRSHSPRTSYKKRRSPSRDRDRRSSPQRERKRSRSPQRKRSRSHERHASPQRKRSRTPERERLSPQRKKSVSTKRRSSSPHDYDQPIKRQADSTRRSYRSRSRSYSPGPSRKTRESRYEDIPEDVEYSRRQSPSPYGGQMYSDRPSSSKRSTEKSSSRKDVIDMVKIVDTGKKMERLNKRFETLEQLAQGGFDFEENITIGIHRGPQHLDLDEDVPVNYEFRPKTFVMLYPKKDYSTEMFDREEILAFHHDDILDEESYVEKRTITVKPTEKPKPRATSSSSSSRYREMDYKITVGMDRDSVGDRRLVHDSKSRSSRHDQEVRIRLDSKPDPKYERLYKEQQHQEDRHLLDDEIHRNPSDLRYNLMRKKSGDRDRDRERDRDRDRDRDREWDRDRDRDRDREPDRSRGRDISMMDARARIEAKRKAIGEKSHIVERGPREDSPPQKRFEKRKIGIKTVLPDFKNRPDKFQLEQWKDNPEVIPKGASYYEHDNRSRDDMTYWERKQVFMRTGRFPGAGSFRARGVSRGLGRGIRRNFVPRQPRARGIRSAFMDDWKHDKFSEMETGENSSEKEGKDVKERLSNDRKGTREKERKDKGRKSDHLSKTKKETDIKKEEAALTKDSNVTVTAE